MENTEEKKKPTNSDLSYHCPLNNTISQLFTYIYIILGMLNNLELIQSKQEIDYMQIYCIIYTNYMQIWHLLHKGLEQILGVLGWGERGEPRADVPPQNKRLYYSSLDVKINMQNSF